MDNRSTIEVHYKDDDNFIHIIYIRTQREVQFLQERFGKENVEVVF